MGWVSALVWFNILLTIAISALVGRRAGGFNFDDMQWFIVAVTVQTFLQIVGLGFVAVRFLFSYRPGR